MGNVMVVYLLALNKLLVEQELFAREDEEKEEAKFRRRRRTMLPKCG